MKQLLRDAASIMETWWARFPQDMLAGDKDVLTRMQAAIEAPDQEPVAYELFAKKFATGSTLLYDKPTGALRYCGVRPLYAAPDQPTQVTCQIYGHVVGACGECNTHGEQPTHQYPLPDSLYPGSKDWIVGDYAERVEWLHGMYENQKEQTEMYVTASQPVADDAFKPDWAGYRQGVEDGKAGAELGLVADLTDDEILEAMHVGQEDPTQSGWVSRQRIRMGRAVLAAQRGKA